VADLNGAGLLVRAMTDADWDAVREIYAEGIATGDATFETEVPSRDALAGKWLPGHRWIADLGGAVVGWTAMTRTSARDCYAGVVETSVYVTAAARGRGVGRALVARQVAAADAAGLWTLQTSIFPENTASISLHHAAGYRTVGVRERIARHHGRWRDTVLLERRSRYVT
jgi:L-amino acid N-acyltransferase YncA